MVQKIEGSLTALGCSFAIIVSRFNGLITNQLLAGALDCLVRHGAEEKNIKVVYCPGAFELPQVALSVAQSGSVDALICLGCIIRGETPHFNYVATEVTRGIGSIPLQTGVPVAFGVLTVETLEQALERAGAKAGNKGWEAALAAVELVQLSRQLSQGTKGSKS